MVAPIESVYFTAGKMLSIDAYVRAPESLALRNRMKELIDTSSLLHSK